MPTLTSALVRCHRPPEMTGGRGKIRGMRTAAKRRYLSLAEAAERLGMSTWSVYRGAIELGTLPAFRLSSMGATSDKAMLIQFTTFTC
jgi:hypothetical protein